MEETALARILGMIPWTLEVPELKARSYRDTRGPGTAGTQAVLNVPRSWGDAKGARDTASLRTISPKLPETWSGKKA